MTTTQRRIINRLLLLAENSELNTRHAAGIAQGGKLICSAINNNRTKFGKDVFCCGHSEVNVILKYLRSSFRGKGKQQLVLAG
tara:strand:+ start:615 stop:863 length:249 start_codon:yes stop_codon:yes gene_type:complete